MLNQKIIISSVLCLFAMATYAIAQGPLIPPGAPGETMKSLTQVYDKATSAVQAATTAVVAANEATAAATDAEDKRIPLRNPLILPIGATALITISQPGSYYLAENIKGWANKAGIKITTSSVTLDLNGYSMIAVPASTFGIHITAGGNHILKNGTVCNWGNNGIYASAGEGGICESIISASNGGVGFALGHSYKAIKCVSRGNQAGGFVNPAPGAILEDCTATSNAASGFVMYNGIAVKCTSNYNTYAGFDLGGQSKVHSWGRRHSPKDL